MDAAKSVTATFTLNAHALTVVRTGTGRGRVASTPAGIDCGSDCSETLAHGAAITLTATPTTGSTFAGWTGAGCTGTGACTLTMDAARTVTATFNLISVPVTITTPTSGTIEVEVTSEPQAAAAQGTYPFGTVLRLTAVPPPTAISLPAGRTTWRQPARRTRPRSQSPRR